MLKDTHSLLSWNNKPKSVGIDPLIEFEDSSLIWIKTSQLFHKYIMAKLVKFPKALERTPEIPEFIRELHLVII